MTKLLFIRNAHVILGEWLDDPSSMVITWFPPDYDGGTTHAVRIAQRYDIPVFNVYHEKDQEELCKFIGE